jgi:hypothetical protein
MNSRSVERRIIGFGLIIGSIAAALLLSSQAEAGNPKEHEPAAVAAAQQAQGQLQGQLQGQGQQQGLHSDIAVDTSLTGGDSISEASADGTQTTLVDASSVYERSVGTLIMGTVIPVDCGFGGQAGGANTNASGFLGASWTTDRCYTLKVANAWATMGEYEYACEMLMDVSRRALKRRGIVGVDCAVIGARLRGWHAMPTPVVTRTDVSNASPPAGSSNYVTQDQLRDAVDRAFKKSVGK